MQYRSYAPAPMARCRPRHFHCGDHWSSNATKCSSEGACMIAWHADESSVIFVHEKDQGGATGPGLKSRSWRMARGTGGRVNLALGSALPLGTGSACFNSVSVPSVARTTMESMPATSRAGPYCGSKLLLAFVGALNAPASSNRRLRPSVSSLLCWNLAALS